MDTLKEKQSLAKTMLQDGQEILEGRFMIVKKLGSGAFGEIYKGKYIRQPDNQLTTKYIFVPYSDLLFHPSNFVEFSQNLAKSFKKLT